MVPEMRMIARPGLLRREDKEKCTSSHQGPNLSPWESGKEGWEEEECLENKDYVLKRQMCCF